MVNKLLSLSHPSLTLRDTHLLHTVAKSVVRPSSKPIVYFASAAVAVDSSHITALSSASWSTSRPPSNFAVDSVVHGLLLTTVTGKWLGETQSVQVSTTSWPVRKQFIYRDRIWRRRRSKPGCRIVGSVAIVWLTTEADDQSSLRCVIVSTDVKSGRDASRGRGSKPPRIMWQGTP